MKILGPVVIVDDTGDIRVFVDAKQAAEALEAIDVEDGIMHAYDSEGHVLTLLPRPYNAVAITFPESAVRNEAALRQVLITALRSRPRALAHGDLFKLSSRELMEVLRAHEEATSRWGRSRLGIRRLWRWLSGRR